jgi:hypothetical protein
MATVEPVFANLQNKGMRRFTLRGRRKVNVQWQLFTMVHNIEKMLMGRGGAEGPVPGEELYRLAERLRSFERHIVARSDAGPGSNVGFGFFYGLVSRTSAYKNRRSLLR